MFLHLPAAQPLTKVYLYECMRFHAGTNCWVFDIVFATQDHAHEIPI